MTLLDAINAGAKLIAGAQQVKKTIFERGEEFERLIRQANVERASRLIIELREENPNLSALVETLMFDTPELAMIRLGVFVPNISKIDGAKEFVEKVQMRLQEELAKPRPSLGRIKG